jgi:hypothetical protein
MRERALLALLVCACGDNRGGGLDGGIVIEDSGDGGGGGDLFGEPCVQPQAPEIGICREGEGACHDEAGGSVCRPFCHVGGEPQCSARMGIETVTDRGACVCVPS